MFEDRTQQKTEEINKVLSKPKLVVNRAQADTACKAKKKNRESMKTYYLVFMNDPLQ